MITSILFGVTCFSAGFGLGVKWQKMTRWVLDRKNEIKSKIQSSYDQFINKIKATFKPS
jgi:DNA-directed RNA polymerase subunit N (RpoN/RPB10)